MSLAIIFFGNERLATGLEATEPLVLQALLDHGYQVGAVITRDTPGRSRKQRPLEIEALAAGHNIPVLKPAAKAELAEMAQAHPAEIGVLAAFGMIVPQEVINAFPQGIINLHPSQLPRYRGTTPIEQAILDGVPETGVSVMQLDERMDAGPVLAQRPHKLSGNESKADLATALHQVGAKLLLEQLEQIAAGTARPAPQNDSAATFCNPLTKSDGIIDWNKPAIRLEREVRAYLGWPGSRTTLFGREVTLTRARVATVTTEPTGRVGSHSVAGNGIWVQTADGTLAIQRLKPAGKREMDAAAFARGQQKTL